MEGGIANLSPYNFYVRMAAVRAQEPLSGKTIKLDDTCSEDIADRVIQSSRDQYARLYVPPESKPKKLQEPANREADASNRAIAKTLPKKGRLKSARKKSIYQQAAQWMMDEINRVGYLERGMAAGYIDKKFGKDCVEQTEFGNPSISKKVRDDFKKLHRGSVGWNNDRQVWSKLQE